jgi:DNA repair exonuclease SbcCD nuclease subunit
MKFVILGDLHLGARNDLKLFLAHSEKFFNYLFDIMKENEIDVIFQLGDLWDRRKYINFHTLREARRIFFDKLRDNNIKMVTLLGNHDIFLRESVEINASELLLQEYDNIEVCNSPTVYTIDNTTIDLIPWMCKGNEEEIGKFILASNSDLCFGHLELAGFAMNRGMEAHDGASSKIFEKYERVWSGHYHTHSERDNIVYTGTPYELTQHDYNDPKGFFIFDTTTREYKFIVNPNKTFIRIDYDDTQPVAANVDVDITNCFVKVICINKTDLYKFDQFIYSLYNKGCYDIKIIEDLSEFSAGEIGEDINLEDTMDVMCNYIDSIDTDVDKDKVKAFIKSLYVEAINLGVI